ncbi:MAG TPA: hypothetical protein VMI32_02740 [Candidatus Solibacter sp.]|nr:hypothetical protein [Candidatus Solibacter sp.]
MPDKRKILNSIAAAARKLGRAPSRAEFQSQCGISAYFVLQYFRTWSEAVRAAGLRPYTRNAKIESRALLEDWGEAVRKNRAILPRHIHLRLGNYNPGTLAKRFGGWGAVPEAFRNFAKGKREWADVMALLPPCATRRAARPTGRKATRQLPRSGPAPAIAARRRWHVRLRGRPIYGNPSPFQWLRHEPVNEQAVVFLFGMLAKKLGYWVQNVQKGFPDCEALRQIGPGRWQRVSIEFEFESKNYREHGHPISGCDVIVCWRHNWPECPRHIEVIELAGVIESMRKAENTRGLHTCVECGSPAAAFAFKRAVPM